MKTKFKTIKGIPRENMDTAEQKSDARNERFARFEALLKKLTPKQQSFLQAFRVCGRVERAARMAECSKVSHYNWLANDSMYREAFELCSTTVCDWMEHSLVPRLIHGWLEPVYQGGVLVGHKRKYDNMGAIRYLEHRSPKFKPSSTVDVSGKLEKGALPIIFHLPSNGREAEEESTE